MKARQMDERTYNHISKTPSWLLKSEFSLRYKTDKNLRRDIADRFDYMFRREDREWLD
tara:strand:+ start:664 stop:837 length:174 start_codon:yes stop_codon:yes gene_type:complete